MSIGHVIVSVPVGFPTVTVTLKQQDFTFPQPSVAWWQTCVVPTGNVEPLAGPAVRTIMTVPAGQVETAVGIG